MSVSHGQQTIEAVGRTWKEARSQIESQLPEGLSILSVEIIACEGSSASWGCGDTIDEAYADAQARARERYGADCETARSVLVSPAQEIVTVEAFDEQSAREQVESQVGHERVVRAIRLVAPGRSGLLGLGKTPARYEAELIRQAQVEIGYWKEARISATIGVPPELSQHEMKILHDLLAIFSTHTHDVTESGLRHYYAEWWYENQGVAPELAMKLKVLSESGSRVLDRGHAKNMEWLLWPATTPGLFRGFIGGPFSRGDIAAALGSHGVTRWSVCNMHVLGIGELRCEALFDECYRVLGEALGG